MMDRKMIHLLIVALAAQVITARVMCPSHPNCVCGGTFAVELNCNIDGRTVKIDILPSTYINIKCENTTSLDYSKLPKCADKMNAFKSVSFKDCPLPKYSFKDILDQIGVSKTMSLIFQNSKPLMGYFNRNHFAGLHDLTKLLLSVNGITYLPDNLFMDVNNITWLNIRCNNINLSEELFRPLEKLETLEISHNHMTNMSSNLFSHLSFLRKLSLWQSNVTRFSKDFFTGVDVLEELDLSSNGLNELPTSIFRPLKKLKKLTLFSNRFSTLPQDLFSTNNKLETVVILNNDVKIEHLPSALFANLPHLKQVYIQRSGIEIVPFDIFANSNYITNISLAYNDIENVSETTFDGNTNLLELDLSHNKLKVIEEELFSSLTKLEILDLSYNSIEELENSFSALNSLLYLNLEHNYIKRMSPIYFNKPRRGISISLAYNNLNFEIDPSNDIYSYFKTTSPVGLIFDLKMLNLSHNKFEHTFEDWFQNGHENLDISNNRLQRLWASHPTKRSINSIYELTEKYKKLSISNNPLTCSCLDVNFVTYLKEELDWKVIGKIEHCSYGYQVFCNYEYAVPAVLIVLLLSLMLYGIYLVAIVKKEAIIETIKKAANPYAQTHNTNECKNIIILYSNNDKEFVCNEILPHIEGNKHYNIQEKCIELEDNTGIKIRSGTKNDGFTLIIFSPNYLMAAYKNVNIKKIRGELMETKNTIYIFTDIGPENSIYAFLKEQRDKQTTILWSENFSNQINFMLTNGFKKRVRFSSEDEERTKLVKFLQKGTTDNLKTEPFGILPRSHN